MKLFKSLLVAPAALGLLAPLAANASEVNLNEVSNYSREFEMNSTTFDNPSSPSELLAGGEGLVDSHDHDGSFSSTTTASFSADMAIGSEDQDTSSGSSSTQSYYGFQIDLNTSFTGEDSLDISIDAGNAGGALSELDLNGAHDPGGSDVLSVDGVAYTFPLAGATVFVGDNMDGSTLYSTACVYGGPSNTLDDCGNGNSAMAGGAGTAAGASYEFGDGFAAAVGYTGDGSSTNGLMTSEGTDVFGGQLSYTADSYGASITYANTENYAGTKDRNFFGLNGYWTPEETGAIPSISGGYEIGDAQGLAETTQWFVGLQWDEAGPGTLGTAIGTQGAFTDTFASQGAGGDESLLMYEVFYSYEINDGMTITPLIYTKESVVGVDDKTGVMVKTSFSF